MALRVACPVSRAAVGCTSCEEAGLGGGGVGGGSWGGRGRSLEQMAAVKDVRKTHTMALYLDSNKNRIYQCLMGYVSNH